MFLYQFELEMRQYLTVFPVITSLKTLAVAAAMAVFFASYSLKNTRSTIRDIPYSNWYDE